MPYGYNPVAPAMSRVANRLASTGQQMGQSRRQDSEMALQRAAFDKNIADEQRYVTPVRERQLQDFNEKNAAEDRGLNLYTDFYGGGMNPQGGVNRPDGVIFAFRDQQAGPGSMNADFVQSVTDRYGLNIDQKTGDILDEKGNPIPKRLLKTKYPHLVNEFRRVTGIYRDPERDLEDRRSWVESGIQEGRFTGEQAAGAKTFLEKTKDMPIPKKMALNERYLDNLYATRAYDIEEGRDTSYIDYQINRIENRVKNYQSQMSEKDKRAYEMWKTQEERRYNEGRDTVKQRNAMELERLRQSGKTGKTPTAQQTKLENEYALRNTIGEMQSEGIKIGADEDGRLAGDLSKDELARAKAIAAKNGMTIYAQPFESDQTVEGTGILGTNFFGDNETRYRITDIVPNGGGMQESVGNGGGMRRDTGGQPASGHGEPNIFGYGIRKPSESENAYFKANPNVGGMAAEDGKIILNPYSKLSDSELQSVAVNEAVRLFMRDNKIVPDFGITDQQRKAFSGTAYGTDDAALKETIVARIISGDPSAQATPEQKAFAEDLANKINGGGPGGQNGRPEGLPPNAEKGKDGEWYVPTQGGGWAKAVVEEPAPAGQGARQALQNVEQSPWLGNRDLPPEREELVRSGVETQPAMTREKDPYEGIPKTRADLRVIKWANDKLAPVGLDWNSWKKAYGYSDALWNNYVNFVNAISDKILSAYSKEELSSDAVKKRMQAIAKQYTPHEAD